MVDNDYKFKKIEEYKGRVLKEKIYDSSNVKKYDCCPYCGCKYFIKYGKYQGIQRYKCKNKECKKTFSNTTNSIWKYSKLEPEKWLKYIELMLEGCTLRYIASVLDISVVTAFYLRHKILHAVEINYKPEVFKEVVHIRVYSKVVCFKGSKNKHFTHEQNAQRKIKKMYCAIRKDVDILFSKDGISLPLIKATMPDDKIEDNFLENVCPILSQDCYVHPDSCNDLHLIKSVVESNKKVSRKVQRKYDMHIEHDYSRVNLKDNICDDEKMYEFIGHLAAWQSRFRGIASKYLDHYYNFYSLINSEKLFNYMEIFFELLKRGRYVSTCQLKEMHIENY